MRYRAEIDGLRAVAVIPVILFHAGFELFSGGFVGVDVFFVISGYLITTILLSELDDSNFSLIKFYERRARRILPALFVVLIATIPCAWFWLSSSDMKGYSKSLFAVAIFSSNILFWLESGYFDVSTELKPLLHTWSLAVEEQYYLFFPLLLAFVWRFGKKFILFLLIVLFLVSLSASHWAAYNEPTPNYYLLPTRGWEIILGAFIAYYFNLKERIELSNNLNHILSFLGMALLIYSIFFFDSKTPFPSLYALVPTLGAGFLIISANQRTFAYKILSSKVLVRIGIISYSAYLWHQPIFAFARQLNLYKPSMYLMTILAILVFPLAYLSWRYVENPFRNRDLISRNTIFLLSTLGMVFFISVGLFGYLNNGFDQRIVNGIQFGQLEKKLEINHGLSEVCEQTYTESNDCLFGENPQMVLWGDSYAMHLAQALQSSASALSFRQHAKFSCRPILDISVVEFDTTGKWASGCIEYNKKVLDWLMSNDKVRYVILSSPFTFSHGKVMVGNVIKDYDFNEVSNKFIEMVVNLKKLGKKVVVISPPPKNGQNIGACFSKAIRLGYSPNDCNFNRLGFTKPTIEAFNLLKRIEEYVPVIWLDKLICNDVDCSVSFGDVPIYRDQGHLSKPGSSFLGKSWDLTGLIINLTTDNN